MTDAERVIQDMRCTLEGTITALEGICKVDDQFCFEHDQALIGKLNANRSILDKLETYCRRYNVEWLNSLSK